MKIMFCPVCGHRFIRPTVVHPLPPFELEFYWCTCGLQYLHWLHGTERDGGLVYHKSKDSLNFNSNMRRMIHWAQEQLYRIEHKNDVIKTVIG